MSPKGLENGRPNKNMSMNVHSSAIQRAGAGLLCGSGFEARGRGRSDQVGLDGEAGINTSLRPERPRFICFTCGGSAHKYT